ncbi:MAG: hypothetical protein FI718_09465 [SAR202 cluster bacterium]|nr:hypothetical protein [Chloroflexota bacterium]MQG40196.1 hypothetical protein [SAR202 cluster bacterium]|tara:strand:+ start:161 stop:349 length:189 start_codon:yes stop_codon:yes gene_type:complete
MAYIDDLISNGSVKINVDKLPRGVPFVISDDLIVVRQHSSPVIQDYWKKKAIAYYNDIKLKN